MGPPLLVLALACVRGYGGRRSQLFLRPPRKRLGQGQLPPQVGGAITRRALATTPPQNKRKYVRCSEGDGFGVSAAAAAAAAAARHLGHVDTDLASHAAPAATRAPTAQRGQAIVPAGLCAREVFCPATFRGSACF
jgi:Mrp family chromosome partitioning ATPase